MNLATTVSIKYVPEENGKKIRKHNGNHRGFFILFCLKKNQTIGNFYGYWTFTYF